MLPQAATLQSIMSIFVYVHLLSGNRVSLEVEADASVESLKQRAQRALVTGRGRLLNSSGEVLDGTKTITETRLRTGDVLTLHLSQVKLKSTRRGSSFAALLGDKSVVTWGAATYGVDSSVVQERRMCSRSKLLFSHLLTYGGESSAVQGQLKHVQQIKASDAAFAAILSDGSVVTWGIADDGGDSSAVQEQLKNVQQIQASDADLLQS